MLTELTFVIVIVALAVPGLVIWAFEVVLDYRLERPPFPRKGRETTSKWWPVTRNKIERNRFALRPPEAA